MDLQGRGMQTSAHWMSYLARKKQNAAKGNVRLGSSWMSSVSMWIFLGSGRISIPTVKLSFQNLAGVVTAGRALDRQDVLIDAHLTAEPITHQQDIMAFKPVPMLLRALILGSTGARVVSYDLLRVLTTHGRERFTIVKFYCPTATKRDIHMAGLRRAGQGAGVTAALSYPQEQW
ncbi:uncharacterized protein CIMG_10001 [Coccidioides immitis RS]|uniref:Uncharacterized protein n=1 Tax=Coccidioides immitis (strain RS) TaxID=246410 RepID=A0A0E1RZX6_COCIM|nr:uncharacterized protein CIMG_10001 [Coccidioides immitis RS]EAS27396.2 hypothetical protein CIMG_10001 [Coccidioides immitis RS]